LSDLCQREKQFYRYVKFLNRPERSFESQDDDVCPDSGTISFIDGVGSLHDYYLHTRVEKLINC